MQCRICSKDTFIYVKLIPFILVSNRFIPGIFSRCAKIDTLKIQTKVVVMPVLIHMLNAVMVMGLATVLLEGFAR